jgi:lysyl-tRNA synthetase class 2
MSERWQPAASREVVHLRARMLRDIRAFFDQRGVLEVETPLLSSACVTDPNLNSFGTRYREQPLFLNTSPEYCMKRLIAAHGDAVYQICKAFRDGELGPKHNPEFTLLEWYRPGYGMFELMNEVEELMGLFGSLYGLNISGVQKITYADAFQRAAGINPHTVSAEECRSCAVRHGIEQPVGLEEAVDEWLDWLLTQLVMPSFSSSGLTFLYDYPSSQAVLSKLYTDQNGFTVAARFELFYGETELANGFDELLDAVEQAGRFERENSYRAASGMQAAVIDEYLLQALQHGLPACSGVAVGLDRLLMLLADEDVIERILAFPFARI